jgi:hypothetical protein
LRARSQLALAGNAALRNIGVQDLWEQARRERLPRTEWRNFLQKRLIAAPKPRGVVSWF